MSHVDDLSKWIAKGEKSTARNYRIKNSNIKKLQELADAKGVTKAAIINAMIMQTHEDTFE